MGTESSFPDGSQETEARLAAEKLSELSISKLKEERAMEEKMEELPLHPHKHGRGLVVLDDYRLNSDHSSRRG